MSTSPEIAAPSAPLRVTRLVESNFGRVISADITPGTKSLVVLRGPNEAGKTSTLNGLIACLAGKGSAPDMPVRIGAEHAQVEVELSDAIRSRYRITKSYKGGKEWLNVQTVGEDGTLAKAAAPQTLLDSLVSDLSFDPLAFAKVAVSNRQADKDSAARMLFAAIGRADVPEKAKAQKASIAEQRKAVNAEVKQLEATLGVDPMPGQELQPVTDAELKAQMDQAEAHNEARRAKAKHSDDLSVEQSRIQLQIADIDRKISELQQRRANLSVDFEECARKCEAALTELKAMPAAIGTDQLTAGLAQIREHNAKVAQQQANRTKLQQIQAKQTQADSFTTALAAVDTRVEQILAESDLGRAVPGLTYVDGELKHSGVPFSQASGMRRLELSALIGMAANPALRILCIDEGDQLDDASLDRLKALAGERGYTVWMTAIRAGNEGDPDTHLVPVHDGMAIDGNRTATNAENVAMIDAAVAEHQQQRPTLVSGRLAVAAYNPNAFNPNEL